jgi:hypothetical protein
MVDSCKGRSEYNEALLRKRQSFCFVAETDKISKLDLLKGIGKIIKLVEGLNMLE